MASGPEAKLVTAMRKAAKDKYGSRIVVVKYHGGPYTQAGVSDLLVCLNGVFIAVEVKAPDDDMRSGHNGHDVTVKQRLFLDAVLNAGGWATVCRSVEEFLEALEGIDDHE